MSLRMRLRANRRRLIGGLAMALAGAVLLALLGDTAARLPAILLGGAGLAWLALAGEDLIWGGRRG